MAVRSDLVWPMYFAAKDLRANRLVLRKGEPFPLQDKQIIRGYGAAFGVKNADALPFGALEYVETLDVRTEEMAKRIRESGMNLKDAKRLLAPAEAA